MQGLAELLVQFNGRRGLLTALICPDPGEDCIGAAAICSRRRPGSILFSHTRKDRAEIREVCSAIRGLFGCVHIVNIIRVAIEDVTVGVAGLCDNYSLVTIPVSVLFPDRTVKTNERATHG